MLINMINVEFIFACVIWQNIEASSFLVVYHIKYDQKLVVVFSTCVKIGIFL
jgi:hypothetical protein